MFNKVITRTLINSPAKGFQIFNDAFFDLCAAYRKSFWFEEMMIGGKKTGASEKENGKRKTIHFLCKFYYISMLLMLGLFLRRGSI